MTSKLDISDFAALVGAFTLGVGLFWVHPGWLVAIVGFTILLFTLGRKP